MRETVRGTGPGGDVTGSVVGRVRRPRVRESVYAVPPCSTGTWSYSFSKHCRAHPGVRHGSVVLDRRFNEPLVKILSQCTRCDVRRCAEDVADICAADCRCNPMHSISCNAIVRTYSRFHGISRCYCSWYDTSWNHKSGNWWTKWQSAAVSFISIWMNCG